MAHSQIAAFARLAKENSAPLRVLAGQATKLSRTMHDIRYDAVHDEVYVANPFARAILVFRGGANGEEAPIRIIQGPNTQLQSSIDRLDVDPVHNEIFIPNRNSILVFSRGANGDVSPLRVIRGSNTMFRRARAIAVDPIHNVIVVESPSGGYPNGSLGPAPEGGGEAEGRGGNLVIFNRTDNEDVKPRAVIHGPKTGLGTMEDLTSQITVYPPKGWIIVPNPAGGGDEEQDQLEPKGVFVGVWSINDNGDVPPRWKIAGPKNTLKKPRGVTLNPKNKELIVADMRLNSVLTYYFPEIF